MKDNIIYQTLQDRENPDQIENQGPYTCNRSDAWMGTGYYFWDTFIENAHWWGNTALKKKYIITEAKVDLTLENCFDLAGNTEHMLMFSDAFDYMKSKNLADDNTTVSRIINYLRKIDSFSFSAVRINGKNSKNKNSQPKFVLKFVMSSVAHFEMKPPIQICFFDLKEVNFRSYRVIYPDYYSQDYQV